MSTCQAYYQAYSAMGNQDMEALQCCKITDFKTKTLSSFFRYYL